MNTQYDLENPFEIECKIKVSDSELYKFGILSFDRTSGCKLSIFGGLGIRKSNSLRRIIGYLSSGEEFILYKCIKVNFDYFKSAPAFPIDRYEGSVILIGNSIHNNLKLKFKSIQYATSNSSDFFYESNIDIKRSSNQLEVMISNLTTIKIKPNASRHIEVSRTPRLNSNHQEGVQAKQTCSIRIKSKTPLKLLTLIHEMQKVKNAVDLLTQWPSNVTYIKLDDIKVIYRAKGVITNNYNKNKIPTIRYREINNIFPHFISSFFCTNKSMQRSMVEYFSVLHHPQRYGSDNYLSLCRSLEAFHRETNKKNTTFRQRIVSLLTNYCTGCMKPLKIHSIKSFAHIVLNYRNSLTHANLSPFGDAKKNFELYKLQIQLEAIFTIILMRHFGINKKLVFQKISLTFIP